MALKLVVIPLVSCYYNSNYNIGLRQCVAIAMAILAWMWHCRTQFSQTTLDKNVLAVTYTLALVTARCEELGLR